MIEIRLAEYESVSVRTDQITDSDLGRLHALQASKRFTVAPDRTGWRLTASATVGVLGLDRLRLIITPKIAFDEASLLRWLCYATYTPIPADAIHRWTSGRHGLTDVIAAALLAECRNLLRDGLRRDYLRRAAVDAVLRGRLDVAAQVTRRYGMVDKLHMRTFDRDIDIWENRVCGAALRAARALATDDHLAHQLGTTATEFPTTALPGEAVRLLDRATYSRVNHRYCTAHQWAGLILHAGGVTNLLTEQGHSASSLLLDMPRLWEAVVHRLLSDAAAPLGGTAISSSGPLGLATRGDLSSRPPFRPDVLLRLHTGTPNEALFPADAKYKHYATRTVSAADVHQLLTYIAGYCPEHTPIAAIVHPQPGGSSRRMLRVNGNDRQLGTIQVLGIDTRAEPVQAVDWIRAALWGNDITIHPS
ncbi:PE-PGRS family protein [Nocardia huaxiensis]|uniref:PE-PGRS family protein n=1 Tax=Nocardia huaxiensis TaxID=2755382 RepID=A0A7D6ZL69_9NOCA|nr:PE-PGRS family protein [Nocardia huaxiensis]QLY33307.1 PE-PGRS family protein [Nocardia huaxiensis]